MSSLPATPTSEERRRDAERTKAEILEVARREFARQGYAGARVDEIAALMRTTKRMIYYYFGGKENLYIAVLEKAYTRDSHDVTVTSADVVHDVNVTVDQTTCSAPGYAYH